MKTLATANHLLLIFAVFTSLTLFTGCHQNPMKKYVEETIDIKFNEESAFGEGTLKFYTTRFFTSYRTVCDKEQCGVQKINECQTKLRCNHQGAAPGEPPCDPKKDRICRPDVCENIKVCEIKEVPLYCDVNCRNVPYQDSITVTQKSKIEVALKTADGSVIPAKNVDGLVLGVHTNQKFKSALLNRSERPNKLEYLFDTLHESDNTVAVMKAEGYRLVAGQDFLKLANSFRGGKTAKIEILVESITDKKAQYSSTGSEAAFPKLHQYHDDQ